MVLNDVADVPYDWVLVVTPFQVLKKPERDESVGGGVVVTRLTHVTAKLYGMR